MKNSLKHFIKKTSKFQRIAIVAAIMVMIGAVASISYIATQAANDESGLTFTTSDGLWNYVWDKENEYKLTIVGYNGTDTDIVFPSRTYTHQHDGVVYSDTKVKFTAIDIHTYNYNFFTNIDKSDITSITIPDNITEIGESVFSYCTSLTSVTLPDTMTHIGSNAFAFSPALKSINIPNKLTYLGYSAFNSCSSLTSVKLPDTLTYLGESAFSYCTSLAEVNLPSGLSVIPSGVFQCTAIKNIAIPYGYTYIGGSAFYGCTKLVNVTIPQSVNTIAYAAFSKCDSLVKVIIPDSVTDMHSGVFRECDSLKSVTFSKNMKSIPYETFYICLNLAEVKNIGNITTIDGNSFYECSNLTKLSLPDTLTSIGRCAFSYSGIDPCSLNLKNVSDIEDYAFAGVTFSGEFTIPSKVTYLNSYVFQYARIPKLIIPESLVYANDQSIRYAEVKEIVWDCRESITNYLMQGNTYLEKLTITKDINNIFCNAFENCTSLKEVNAKNINNWVDYYSFQNCTALTTFNAGYINTISYQSFKDCTALTTVNAKCTYRIEQNAFYNCTSLTNISDLIEPVQYIQKNAFYGCSSLGEVKLGNNLSKIYESAFSNSGITYLDAENFIGSIENHTFSSCEKLTEVANWNADAMPYDFANCTALTKFTFGSRGGTNLGVYCFEGCSALTDIYYLNLTHPSLITPNFMYNTPNTETIHYYVPSSGTDEWQTYYNSYGDHYSFVLDAMEPPETTVTVTGIQIDQASPVSIGIGETMQLSATITYSDGSTAPATSDNVVWQSSDSSIVSVDQSGNITPHYNKNQEDWFATISVHSKENANLSVSITVNVSDKTAYENKSALNIELYEVYIDNSQLYYLYNESYFLEKPFVMDKGNNGINASSTSYIRFNIYPANMTDEISAVITEGSDILSISEPTIEYQSGTHNNYTCYLTHLTDSNGNYKYGSVTITITVGDLEPLTYSFDLEKETKIPTVAAFDNSQYQNNKTLEVGQSYKYTAFPTEWDSTNPYMWYEVIYSIDNTNVAELSVETVANAVYDTNTGLSHTARVATLTPKAPGQVKLRAHSGRYKNNYTEITLTITDPTGQTVVKRPNESGDPDVIWATDITFPQDTITLAVGGTRTLTPTILPANNTDEIFFYSYDDSIASIDYETGVITANAVGVTTVGVTTSSGLNANIKVIVTDTEVHTTKVELTPSKLELKVGASSVLQATITPENTTDSPVWTSTDSDIVTVNGGTVTAVSEGTATVTITSGDYSASCVVTVVPSATSVTLDYTTATIKHGETLQLNATVEPAGVTSTPKWSSSNEAIATVSYTGKVTAVGYGDVDITVTVDNVTAKCTISVVPNLNFKILGASIRVSDPYGIRFGIQLGKTGDYGDVNIVEYGTVMMPTEKLGDTELTLATPQVLKVPGKSIYSETSSELVYTGVLINIPDSFFNTDVSGRGYLTYEDDNGVQHTIYTDVVSRSFTGVAQSAYDSYSKISNPSQAQLNVLDKLKSILNIQ